MACKLPPSIFAHSGRIARRLEEWKQDGDWRQRIDKQCRHHLAAGP
jgi:hypothetical protein